MGGLLTMIKFIFLSTMPWNVFLILYRRYCAGINQLKL